MGRNATYALLIGLLVAWVAPAFAQPPAHAPAHGWRTKNDPYYTGYAGKQWERDFDISSGRCNRQEIATVIGGIAGGVIANRVADEHKPFIGKLQNYRNFKKDPYRSLHRRTDELAKFGPIHRRRSDPRPVVHVHSSSLLFGKQKVLKALSTKHLLELHPN
jgi:hypothetical protein